MAHQLSQEHRQYLTDHAIDADLAERLGVRTVDSRADMEATGDEGWANFANFPAILFPWTSSDGRVMYQARPDEPTIDQKTGRPRKYVFRKDSVPVLWALREVPGAKTALVIEGTKQGLAGATHAPDDVSVYSIAGCRMWQKNGIPIPDLAVLDGMDVVICLDADAGTNPDVYQAGHELAEALLMEGVQKIRFTRMPGGGKSGLDDVLTTRKPERRGLYMKSLIDAAKPKPADARPKPKRGGSQVTDDNDRKTVVVNDDRLTVINELTQALVDKWNSRELFCHGGVISRRVGGVMVPVDKGAFHDLVQVTAKTVNRNEGAQGVTDSFGWPDAGTMSATMSRSDRFAKLDRMVHAPFVRPDGTIVTEPGYDETTRTLLMPDDTFTGLEVPESPTPEQISAARELILTEWLGDFPFDTQTDRANVLALMITPAIRGLVPRAPMAVVDGLQMGVGKNLIADGLLTLYTGHAATPMNWVEEGDELRKQITSAFRTGAELFVFDEAHTLQGAALAQALTAETWQDRILGVSTMANFPNRVTWVSLGNQVQVKGDITRRVYRIFLKPTVANPQDRDASSFRHPGQSGLDLLSWTRANRKALLTAVLTLVRAWFAAGSPVPKRGVSFGSFEMWERMIGGIIETAGVIGFLDNLRVWRSESDFDSQYWTNHLVWLREKFGVHAFRTADVRREAITAGSDVYLAPPRLDDPTEKTYGKALGEAYGRIKGRRYGKYWLDRVGSASGNVGTYAVFSDDDRPPEPETVIPPDPDTEESDCPHGIPLEFCRVCHEDIETDNTQPVEEPVDNASPGEVMTDKTDTPADIHGPLPVIEGSIVQAAGWCKPGGVTFSFSEVDQKTFELITGQPDVDLVTVDLETGDATDLYRSGPGYVRIGATAADDQHVEPYGPDVKVPERVVSDIRHGRTITGHNIMAFDLPALVREGTITMPEIHRMAADGRFFDGMIVARYLDPPMARETGVDHDRKYDLATLATTYGLGEKLTEISHGLDKKYGGWGNIPIDPLDADPERARDAQAFTNYMVRDVDLSRSLFHRLDAEIPSFAARDYIRREHRVAAIAAQISLNGFLVDQELVAQRIAEIEARKSVALRYLAAKHGVPLKDPKGNPYKSPLASGAGKQAVAAALIRAGVPERFIWRTEKEKAPQISADAMMHYGREYHHLLEVRKIATAVHRVVSARTVYETVYNNTCPDGRVHPGVSFKQATGRWSLTSPGLTVMGKRGGRHVERAILLPDPGEVLLSIDLSQVDMRALAGLSRDQAYTDMLMHEDPHSEIARLLFGDAARREDAKAIGHGWNYRRGLEAISNGGDIAPSLVKQFDTSMRERFARLVEWQEEVTAIAESGQLLDNGWGRLMRPDPRRAYTQGPALMGQGCARDIMMQGLLNVADKLPQVLPMLRAQVHDEIVLSVPQQQAEEIGREVVDCLSFEWNGVPILADVSRPGTDWSLCYAKG